MKSLLKASLPLVFFLLTCTPEVVADPVVWKVTVTNTTGMTVTGLHLNFTGTGGSIRDASIIMNGAGAGAATVIGMSSTIDVTWAAPGLPAGGVVMIQFTTDFAPIAFNDGFWVKPPPQPPVDPNDVTVQEIPEPVTLLLLGTGLAGLAVKSRKKLRSKQARE